MIDYDDLLVARIIHSRVPRLRDSVLRALESLVPGENKDGLLNLLVSQGLLSRKAAQEIYDLTIQQNRRRALKLFVHLLCRDAGLSTRAIKESLNALGERGDAIALGEELARRELISREGARNLRYRTRIAFDRYRAEQVANYRKKARRSGLRRATVESMTAPELNEDDGRALVEEDLSAPSEAQILLDRTFADGLQLEAPRFPVPDWIDMSDPLTGRSIRGYRLLGLIGTGGMGKVYLCDSASRPGPIALKLLSKDADDETRARFKREVFIQGVMPPHPRVIELYDAGTTESGYHYLAMEFFDSTDLFKLLKTEPRTDPARAVSILRNVCEALEAIHGAGIVHRDMKPANILVSNQDHGAKLADFGIALSLEMEGLDGFVFKSMDGTVTGTAEFVSPEQALGAEIDGRSDLYSLGIVMYLMLSGALPFECENSMGYLTSHMLEAPRPLADAMGATRLPKALLEINEKLLSKNPAERFQSAREVDDALARVRFQVSEVIVKPRGLWSALGLGS